MEKNGIFNSTSSFNKFSIRKLFSKWTKFNDVYSRVTLPKEIKDGVNVINLDEYADVGTHWVALFCNRN